MKKYRYQWLAVLFAAAVVSSCTEDEGTEPGNDSEPVITIYQYEASRPNNPDNDVVLRFVANSQTTDGYYLAELTADKESRVASQGESGYMDYVVSNGSKLNISSESVAEVTLTDLYGNYTITAVAVNGSQMTSSETTFTGLDWSDVVTGTYYYGASSSLDYGAATSSTTLQVCTTDATLYRFKDVFGSGYSLKINLIDQYDRDSDGEYQFFRIPEAQETPFVYGSYGTALVRDIGYWQGNDAYVTDYGYESGMYADKSCFLCIQYYVSAGSLGYGYEYFIPD